MTAAIVGIPTTAHTKNPGERFPCENSACGCSSADVCWDRCCCHTDTEKLAWARRNRVVPPSFLVKRVAENQRTQIASSPKPSCCCCDSQNTGVLKRKTKSGSDQMAKRQDAEAVDAPSGELKMVLVWKAAQCRGADLCWSFLFGLVIDVPQAIFSFAATPQDRIVVVDESAVSWMQPPVPPVPWRNLGLAFSSSPLPRV
jgi:hypothetical protein